MVEKIFRRLAQDLCNAQFTITSLEKAIAIAKGERRKIISKMETELACDNFKYLFGKPIGPVADSAVDALSQQRQAPPLAPAVSLRKDPSKKSSRSQLTEGELGSWALRPPPVLPGSDPR